jgi:hypothetical protein
MTTRKFMFRLLVGSIALMFVAMAVWAQDTTATTTKTGTASKTTQVEQGTIVLVSGNELVIKMQDGTIRHITVPPGATAMVDGKQIGIKDAKPGMVLQKAVTTTSTPKTIITTRTIRGKVWYVNPPTTVILSMDDGSGNKKYKVPKGQTFDINGQQTDVFHLKKGMDVTATVIKEVPETVIAQQAKVTGQAPPPPPPPPANQPIMVEEVAVVEEVAEAEPAPEALPKTGSFLPLIGLIGGLMMAGAAGMRLVRK